LLANTNRETRIPVTVQLRHHIERVLVQVARRQRTVDLFAHAPILAVDDVVDGRRSRQTTDVQQVAERVVHVARLLEPTVLVVRYGTASYQYTNNGGNS
jgi:hypothetical protein